MDTVTEPSAKPKGEYDPLPHLSLACVEYKILSPTIIFRTVLFKPSLFIARKEHSTNLRTDD